MFLWLYGMEEKWQCTDLNYSVATRYNLTVALTALTTSLTNLKLTAMTFSLKIAKKAVKEIKLPEIT